jgi:S1-C subfamily serine protease
VQRCPVDVTVAALPPAADLNYAKVPAPGSGQFVIDLGTLKSAAAPGVLFWVLMISLMNFLFVILFCLFGSAYAQETKPAPAAAQPGPAAVVPLPEPSAPARDLFSRYKDRLVQVRVLLNSASEQSSLGSGFVVRDAGAQGAWVLTNYHVISSLAIDPAKYRIELRGTNGRNVKARLVALDAIHDLAVLHMESDAKSAPWNVLALRDSAPSQGSRIYSLGNPLELGFLISEGIFNGLVESRVYDEMLFSGALNSGMSGGPAIDEQGRVVGVNVSTRRDGELLSFLVPVRYAQALLTQALNQPPGSDWRKTIAAQLLVHQDFLMDKLWGPALAQSKTGFSSQTLAGRTVPTLDGGLVKCWANGLDGEKKRYQRDALNCNLRSNLFVSNHMYTGTVSLNHVLLRNEKLATPQFLSLENHRSGTPFFEGGTAELTRSQCEAHYMQPGARVYRVAVCLRAYRKFEGLYDYSFTATQVDDAQERQTSQLQVKGFSAQNGQRLMRLFLERLS